ncbi:PAS modulated sigma54 specific transcriptional regulator, Fis family [uncultured delta proteobacterium]|uniref:PAS modulated sigma54 specific transcriptional regulator, Fis family n=1 Tax=uncultured delta proteobacterium TaxID=34034 RepID=A0A212JM85_9DELT|nr:PAS modulated sigma54 specific transcriptional regulator, Fis family [uncultured delta proteobacterium]
MTPHEIERLQEEIRRLEAENSALARKAMCFEAAVDMIAEGYIVIGKDGAIDYINQAYCQQFGVKREDALGMPIEKLIPNTRLIYSMENDLLEIDVLHEFPEGLTVSGERKAVSTRIPIKLDTGEVIACAALTKFSGYAYKLLQSIHELEGEVEYYRSELSRHADKGSGFENIPTSNAAYRKVKKLAERFAKSDLPVLLRGETGVGKEVFAKAIHAASARSDGPFISINCSSIPAELLESELFGYEDGAFTGGRRGGKRGKFELAHGGTLLLDEVGDMPLAMQVKLLRVLQDGYIEKVGGEKKTFAEVRILAATNQNLEEKIEDKTFREDLYYRLNVLPIVIPPLRERKEDIPALAYAFLGELNDKYEPRRTISPEALAWLQRYTWPGNIRELKNVIGRAFITCEGRVIQVENLPQHLLNTEMQQLKGRELRHLSSEQESSIILAVLRENNFNCSKAAKALSIHRATLYAKLGKFNIRIADLRTVAVNKPG